MFFTIYLLFTVPSSYAAAVEPTTKEPSSPCPVRGSKDLLCPFLAQGDCPYEDDCEYLHGDICDMCGFAVLHPEDSKQRDNHQKVNNIQLNLHMWSPVLKVTFFFS